MVATFAEKQNKSMIMVFGIVLNVVTMFAIIACLRWM